jgi:hypothetical protein
MLWLQMPKRKLLLGAALGRDWEEQMACLCGCVAAGCCPVFLQCAAAKLLMMCHQALFEISLSSFYCTVASDTHADIDTIMCTVVADAQAEAAAGCSAGP